jgi:hypothetical protein
MVLANGSYQWLFITNYKCLIQLIFVLIGENIFRVDSILAAFDSFEEVKSSDEYTLTKWQYYDDWIIREIDHRQPLPL